MPASTNLTLMWIRTAPEAYCLDGAADYRIVFERGNWYGYYKDRVLAAGTMAEVTRKLEEHYNAR